jgi:hypothetical protein
MDGSTNITCDQARKEMRRSQEPFRFVNYKGWNGSGNGISASWLSEELMYLGAIENDNRLIARRQSDSGVQQWRLLHDNRINTAWNKEHCI